MSATYRKKPHHKGLSNYDTNQHIQQAERNTTQRLGRNGRFAGLSVLAIKMLITMEKRIINGQVAYVGDALKGFSIHTKESTNVEYFGCNPNGKIFAQFKNGYTYIYSLVPDNLRAEIERASSVGGFIAQLIVKPKLYPSVKYSDRLVVLEKQVGEGQLNAVDQWL